MKRISLLGKLIFICVLTLLPVFLMFAHLISRSEEILRNKYYELARETVLQVKSDIELLIRTIDGIITPICYLDDTIEILTKNTPDSDSISELQNFLNQEIQVFWQYHNTSFDLLLVDTGLNVVCSNASEWIGTIRNSIGAQWLSRAQNMPRGRSIVISGYTVFNEDYTNSKQVIAIMQAIRNTEGNCIGYLIGEINMSFINNICNRHFLGKRSFMTIIDSTGAMLFNTSQGNMFHFSDLKQLDTTENSGFLFGLLNNERFMYTKAPLSYSGMEIITIIPEAQILSELNHLRSYTIRIIALLIPLTIIFNFILSRSITTRIKKLQRQMKEAETGLFPIVKLTDSSDEIGQLQNSFANMLMKLQELIDSEYSAKLKEKEALLQALLARINPHSLYNSLEIISMTAYLHKDYEVVNMLQALSNLLRMTTTSGDCFISINREIELIDNYLLLQKAGNYRNLKVEYNISQDLRDDMIMCLLLQPIVENCIIHGFQDAENPNNTLSISINSEDGLLSLVVADNGIGMPETQMNEMNTALSIGDDEAAFCSRIGLKNVNKRIKIFYGSNYGLQLSATPGGGLTVKISIPRMKGKTNASISIG